ncbi:MAG: hypothetical protein R6W96_06505 [Clostridia bacterium]
MKNLINIAKYQFVGTRKPLLIFYFIVILLGTLTSFPFPNRGTVVEGTNFGTISIVFIFILGLNSFKDSYKFMQANNISRRSFYLGNILSFGALAFLMSLIDTCLTLLFKLFIPYRGIFETIYQSDRIVPGFILTFSMLFFAACLGWLVTLIYYRSGTLLKVIVSVSPLILVFLFTYVSKITGGALAEQVYRLQQWALGTQPLNPANGMIFIALFGLIAYGISFLLVRLC